MRFKAMFKSAMLCFGLVLLVGVAGCGNKGPLVLADDAKKAEFESGNY